MKQCADYFLCSIGFNWHLHIFCTSGFWRQAIERYSAAPGGSGITGVLLSYPQCTLHFLEVGNHTHTAFDHSCSTLIALMQATRPHRTVLMVCCPQGDSSVLCALLRELRPDNQQHHLVQEGRVSKGLGPSTITSLGLGIIEVFLNFNAAMCAKERSPPGAFRWCPLCPRPQPGCSPSGTWHPLQSLHQQPRGIGSAAAAGSHLLLPSRGRPNCWENPSEQGLGYGGEVTVDPQQGGWIALVGEGKCFE